jgi:hypothetical protein
MAGTQLGRGIKEELPEAIAIRKHPSTALKTAGCTHGLFLINITLVHPSIVGKTTVRSCVSGKALAAGIPGDPNRWLACVFLEKFPTGG